MSLNGFFQEIRLMDNNYIHTNSSMEVSHFPFFPLPRGCVGEIVDVMIEVEFLKLISK